MSLFVFLYIGLSATHVLITDSHTRSGVQIMDLNWRRTANLLGYTNEIIDKTYLDSLHVLKTADLLIITEAVEDYTDSQRKTIIEYIQQGGHVYVQGEFRINFGGNQLFQYIVNKTGGQFQWEGESMFNVNPIKVSAFIHNDEAPETMSYFWNGTYGCGEETIHSFLELDGRHYGFMHVSENTQYGRVMTSSDQDWIKLATEVGQTHRLVVMRKMLENLTQGVADLKIPNIQISALQKSFCSNAGFDIFSNIDKSILSYDVQWSVNGTDRSEWLNKMEFEASDLEEGDLLQAQILMKEGCQQKIIQSNIVEIEIVYPLANTELSINGPTDICVGEVATFTAISDADASVMATYTWRVNGIDQIENGPTFNSSTLEDGDEITLSAVFDDDCDTTVESQNSITVNVAGGPVPMISLTMNKATYCMGDDATLTLNGIDNDPRFTIEWMVNNITVPNSGLTYTLPSVTNSHEVTVRVIYEDVCLGMVNTSTPVAVINISDPQISINRKINASCGLDNGLVELEGDNGITPYVFSWQAIMSTGTISNIPQGMHQFLLTDSVGCQDSITTTIGMVNPKIIDSLIVSDASCGIAEAAIVNLHTNPTLTNNLTLLWKDDAGSELNVDFSEAELLPGNYEVIAMVNEECNEVRRFEVKSNDLDSRINKQFQTEANVPIQLDLGLDASEVKSIQWPNDEGLDCTDCLSPTFMDMLSTSYNVTLITNEDCEFEFEVFIRVDANFQRQHLAPNIFSPNGDGINDTFEFYINSTIASLDELLIFDRWGSLVFTSTSIDDVAWDGTFNGAPASVGTYIYVAKMTRLNGDQVTGNGTILLKR